MSVAGDGGWRQWQVNSCVTPNGEVPGCVFGLLVQPQQPQGREADACSGGVKLSKGTPCGCKGPTDAELLAAAAGSRPGPVSAGYSAATTTAVILLDDENYNQSGFTPAPMTMDHVVPPSSLDLVSKVPHLSGGTTMVAKFPSVDVSYDPA